MCTLLPTYVHEGIYHTQDNKTEDFKTENLVLKSQKLNKIKIFKDKKVYVYYSFSRSFLSVWVSASIDAEAMDVFSSNWMYQNIRDCIFIFCVNNPHVTLKARTETKIFLLGVGFLIVFGGNWWVFFYFGFSARRTNENERKWRVFKGKVWNSCYLLHQSHWI